MRKIIHLSDPHCENNFEEFGTVLDRIFNYTTPMPDNFVVVVTGDLLDSARDWGVVGFQKIRDLLLSHFSEPKYRVLVCPGNHDYGTGSKQEKGFALDFANVFVGSLIGRDSNGTCPWVDIVDNEIAFIGLDSMVVEVTGDEQFKAAGKLGDIQLTALAKVLRSDEVRACTRRVIYLHHNPLDPLPGMRLEDNTGLSQTIRGATHDGVGVDALLFGHSHKGKSYSGKWDCVGQCYDGGAVTGHDGFFASLFGYKARKIIRILSLESSDTGPEEIPFGH